MAEYQGCDNCGNQGKSMFDYPCFECTHNRAKDHWKPMTNADKIRNMSDEELADILFDDCTIKMGLETCKYLDCDGHDCKKCVFEWLQAEVKEGGEK